MFPTIDARALQRSALAALRMRTIPHDSPLHILGGHGSGETCAVCRRAIDPADMELELEFAPPENGPTLPEFHLHLPCFEAWQSVRTSTTSEA